MPDLDPAAPSSLTLPRMSRLSERQAPGARNLVNGEELNGWLEALARDRLGASSGADRKAACEKWLGSVGRKWMIREGAVEPYAPEGEALLSAPAWAQAALAAGASLQRLALGEDERERLSRALDWMRSDDGPAVGSDWSRVSMEQAERSEKAWVEAMAKAALKQDLEAADAQGSRLFAPLDGPGPDGREGWRWVEVFSKGALDREGALMRHCVGSYAKAVEEGECSVFSLRDADNKPRLTIEAQQGELAQLKAFANQACPPELFGAVEGFARAFEGLARERGWTLSTAPEVEQAGVAAVPGLGLALASEPFDGRLRELARAELQKDKPLEFRKAFEWIVSMSALGWREEVLELSSIVGAVGKTEALARASLAGRSGVVADLLALPEPAQADVKTLRNAGQSGSLETLEALLAVSGKEGNSYALVEASSAGHLALVERLLPVSDARFMDSMALISAAESGHAPVVRALLPHSNPLANHSAALCAAAEGGHMEALRELAPLCGDGYHAARALRLAAGRGHVDAMRELLPISDPRFNHLALASAAESGHMEALEIMLPLCDPKANRSQALSLALELGRAKAVERLLPLSNPADIDGYTLMVAQNMGHGALVDQVKAEIEAAKARDAARPREAAPDPLLPPLDMKTKLLLRRAFGVEEPEAPRPGPKA